MKRHCGMVAALVAAALGGQAGRCQAAEAALEVSVSASQSSPGAGNVLMAMMRAQMLEQEGKAQQAMDLYRDIVSQHGLRSRWGRLAGLRLAREKLCAGDESWREGREIVAQLSAEVDADTAADRWLCEVIGLLQEQVDRILADQELSLVIPPSLRGEKTELSARQMQQLGRMMSSLSDRVIRAGKPGQGVRLIASALEAMDNPAMQLPLFRELCVLCLAADQKEDALRAAQAMWLASVQSPAALADAVERVSACMQALGAGEEDIRKYRQFQTYGPQEGQASSPLNPFLKPSLRAGLFSASRIDAAADPLARARLLLLDGRLAEGAGILEAAIRESQPGSPQHKAGIVLVRMAMALRDGHMLAVDRYERWLASGPQGQTPSPLQEILQQARENG